MNKLIKIFILIGALFGSNVLASTIEYRFSGIATGSVDSTLFFDAAFTVVINGDTADVGTPSDPFLWEINGLSGSININGFGNDTFIDPLYVFNWGDDPDYELIGFGSNTSNKDIIGLETAGTGLVNYDLRSSYGPITGTSLYFDSSVFGLTTGDLTFFGVNEVSFEAIATTSTVPVPAALWLFSSGIIGLLGIARCRTSSGNAIQVVQA